MKKILLVMVSIVLSAMAMAQNATLPQNITIKALDGTTVQTSAIQNDGKPMIISFWATWCKPCNRELNTIKEVYE
jgi:thiol-disulfide isomerase/thioredoxin